MKWPWVNKVQVDVREREIAFLAREVDYWRSKYEVEKERADRGVDSALASVGREPISEPVRAEYTKAVASAIDYQKQISEIFGDVADSVLLEGEQSVEGTTVVSLEPVKTPEQERAERLEVIRESNALRFQKVTGLKDEAAAN